MLTGSTLARIEEFVSATIPYFNLYIMCFLILISFGIFAYYVSQKKTGLSDLGYGIYAVLCASTVIVYPSDLPPNIHTSMITLALFFVIVGILSFVEFVKKAIR